LKVVVVVVVTINHKTKRINLGLLYQLMASLIFTRKDTARRATLIDLPLPHIAVIVISASKTLIITVPLLTTVLVEEI
jgi:hypothetical protein